MRLCATGGGAQARRVEIRGIREITGITGRVRFPGTRDVRVGALGPLVDCVENNILILRVGKLRPRERRHQPRSQNQREFSYRREMVNDTLQVGRSGPASVQPWAPVPQRPLASPFSSFSLAHPMVLLGGDYSGAVSEWVGRDFGWRKWEDGTVSPDGAVRLDARTESQDALLLSRHCCLLLLRGGPDS